MAEVEFAGLKFKGGKIFVIITALTTLGGGLWGGFEFYKDYLTMKEQIQEYVAPDLSGFDKRIENFGREAYVKNRKVTFAYTFYRSDKTQYEDLYNMFMEALELNGNKLGNSNIVAFMDICRKHKLTSKSISDDEVLNIYDELSNVVSYKLTNNPKNID